MKHRTADLAGALLDAAVAKAEGLRFDMNRFAPDAAWTCYITVGFTDDHGAFVRRVFAPSTAWEHGGPIIERERISTFTLPNSDEWGAIQIGHGHSFDTDWLDGCDRLAQGPTPLIAAMRAYVMSKLGAKVELP